MPRTIRPDQRRRKVHTRSRGGCGTCKAKHVRCDELKPKCSFCSKRGSSCDYEAVSTTSSDTEPASTYRVIKPKIRPGHADIPRVSHNILPVHSFVGFPIRMTYASRRLFDKLSRNELASGSGPSPDDVLRMWSQPLLLRCSLLITAGQVFWDTGSLPGIEQSIIEHKVEVIREINQRLTSQPLNVDDVTISAIMSLAVLETFMGASRAAEYHLGGLDKLDALRCSNPPSREQSLVHAIVKMHWNWKVTTPVDRIIEICGAPRAQEPEALTELRNYLRPLREALRHDGSLGALTIPEAFRAIKKKAPPNAPVAVAGCAGDVASVNIFVKMQLSLARDNMDPFVVKPMFDRHFASVALHEAAIEDDPCLAGAWLWSVFQSHSYAFTFRKLSDTEVRQAETRQQQCREKLRLASRLLHIRTWDEAKAVLGRWMWLPSREVEDSLRPLWEKAIREGEWQQTDGCLRTKRMVRPSRMDGACGST